MPTGTGGNGRRRPPAALLLAAGASSRYVADRPKALAPVGEEVAVHRLGRVAREAGCDPVSVVVGARPEAIEEAVRDLGTASIRHEAWAAGRTGSIQAGLRTLTDRTEVLLWPVDTPFVAASTVRRLVQLAAPGGLASWWVPTYGGRGGHPFVLGEPAWRLVLELPAAFPLREAPFRGGVAEARVPVDDPAVLDNTNTRAEFEAAAAAWRARGCP